MDVCGPLFPSRNKNGFLCLRIMWRCISSGIVLFAIGLPHFRARALHYIFPGYGLMYSLIFIGGKTRNGSVDEDIHIASLRVNHVLRGVAPDVFEAKIVHLTCFAIGTRPAWNMLNSNHLRTRLVF